MSQMTTSERLIYMANQIARNLEAQGHDAAVLEVADHIAAFWDPRMKARILDGNPAGLSPIAAAAVERLRDRGAPPPQTPATMFGGAGEIGPSDAG